MLVSRKFGIQLKGQCIISLRNVNALQTCDNHPLGKFRTLDDAVCGEILHFIQARC
jgi:hypothetical protein